MRSSGRCAVLHSSEQRVMRPNEVAILKKKRDVIETWRKFSLVSAELVHQIFPDNAANLEKVGRRFQILVTFFPTHP